MIKLNKKNLLILILWVGSIAISVFFTALLTSNIICEEPDNLYFGEGVEILEIEENSTITYKLSNDTEIVETSHSVKLPNKKGVPN